MANLEARFHTSTSFSANDPVMMRFELTNKEPHDVYVLKWHTPLEGLFSPCLKVVRDGKYTVPYDGPLAKRGNPGPNSYQLVPAGQTVTVDVDLSEAYHISPGHYDVSLNTTVQDVVVLLPGVAATTALASGVQRKANAQALRSGGVQFIVNPGKYERATRGEAARITNRTKPAAPSVTTFAAGLQTPIVNGGTPAQQGEVMQAHSDGYNLCVSALSAIANDARFQNWFGDYGLVAQVQQVYSLIQTRMTSAVFTYDLSGTGCQPDWFAYTHRDDTTIWMCGKFWTAPATGTDSKAGTVLHEHSHSDAGTEDIAYGQAAASQLAADLPSQAVRNADNYEYYAGG